MLLLRKMGKGTVATLLSFALVLTACTGGGGNANSSEEGAANAGSEGQAAGEGETFEFSYLLVTRFVNWMNELNWYPVLLERTNTKVELVDGGEGDQYYSNVDLRIGGGDFPDAGMVSMAQAEVYGSQGAFVDLKPLIAEHAPNLQKFIDANPDYAQLITASDGKIYGIVEQYPRIANAIMYREDMFKKAGIENEPRTIEELTEALRKLKAHYSSDSNFYPFTGREDFIKFTETFHANDTIVDDKVHGIYDGGRGFDIYSAGFKDLVTWYNTLYKEGLIDPEWVAGASTEAAWETKFLSGKGALSYDFFTRPAYFMLNGGPDNDPEYNLKVMPYLLDANGKQSVAATSAKYDLQRVFVVNAKAADKAPGILKFLDYMYSEDGQTLFGWGVEGETYKEEGGKKQFIVNFDEEVFKPAGEKRWSFLQDRMTFPKIVNNEAFYEWNNEVVKSFAAGLFTDEYVKSYPILKYSTEQLKERANLLATVKEATLSNVVKFVNGTRPMSEWDAFLAEMEQAGYKKIVEIDQQAYDAMK